jgi:hypothetical protein
VNATASTSWTPANASGGRWLLPAFLVVGGVATIATAIATDGNIIATMAPVLAAAVLGAVWVAPIRITLFALAFLGLALDASGEGAWNSPLAPLGRLLDFNLNLSIPMSRLPLPLTTCVLGYLLIIHLHRRLSRSHVDEVGARAFATPMRLALAVSLLTVVVECLNGFRLGGDLQMAKIQVQDFLLVLLTAYLMAASLRGIRDYRTLGGLIILAACAKALLALYVYRIITPHPDCPLTHGDSLLFTCAAFMLIARFAENPVRRNGVLTVVTLPLLLVGIFANNRRLAWVELAASVVALYFFSRRTPLKRFVTKGMLVALPLILLYVTAGWNSGSRVFAPVKVFRSVTDSDVDASTMFRDLENYNLLYTLRIKPIIGTGFGIPFDEVVTTPDISSFKEYRFMPHNSILGLWCYTGVIGFTGLFMVFVAGVHLAARSYHWAHTPDERAAALTALTMVLVYLIQCYGDIGFSERKSIFLVGAALAVAGQLAVSTGALGGRAMAAVVRRQR